MKNQTLALLLAALMAVFLCLNVAQVRAAHPPSCAPEDVDLWRALPRTASAYKGR